MNAQAFSFYVFFLYGMEMIYGISIVFKQARLFTFLTLAQHSNQVLPGKSACNNEGAVARVIHNDDIFQQMAPYFHYLYAGGGYNGPIWTSPYLDQMGLGLLVTIAAPVYSNITRQ